MCQMQQTLYRTNDKPLHLRITNHRTVARTHINWPLYRHFTQPNYNFERDHRIIIIEATTKANLLTQPTILPRLTITLGHNLEHLFTHLNRVAPSLTTFLTYQWHHIVQGRFNQVQPLTDYLQHVVDGREYLKHKPFSHMRLMYFWLSTLMGQLYFLLPLHPCILHGWQLMNFHPLVGECSQQKKLVNIMLVQ